MSNFTTLGGRVTCTRCNALSKRTRQRCKAPAIRGKIKCRFYGGAKGSGRPIIHGRETREKRAERSAKLAELRELEEVGFKVGLFAEGTPRTRGRKPKLGQYSYSRFCTHYQCQTVAAVLGLLKTMYRSYWQRQ